MFKLDPDSREILADSLDLFNGKPTLEVFQKTSTVEYPAFSAHGTWPMNFRINSGNTYLDLSSLELMTKFRITKYYPEKGTDAFKHVPLYKDEPPKTPVSLINGFGSTFIKDLQVSFNDTVMFRSNGLYAYNAYFRQRLGLTPKEETNGYFEDGLEHMSGPGFDARRSLFENDDATFETICPLDLDFLHQKKLLLNQTIVDVTITPHNSAFVLLTADKSTEYHYHMVACKLYVKQITLLPTIDLKIQDKLNKSAIAKYAFNRNIMRSCFIPAGHTDFSTILFSDCIPNRIFAGLVDAKAFNGSMDMSPFEFSPFNLESIRVFWNDNATPFSPYNLNWSKKKFGRAYKDLLDATGTNHGISVQKYLKNSCIYGFDLQQSHSDQISEIQTFGTTMISLNFKTPVPENGLQLIVFAEFDCFLSMDKTRTFTTTISY
uniref:Major capsid protein n=1 Tax=Panagrolaimus davidi TaxID=227884 RepID=A0A914PCQ7_9BILA